MLEKGERPVTMATAVSSILGEKQTYEESS